MNLPAKLITNGAWSARWGNHLVHLRPVGADRWQATVWQWPPNTGLAARVELDRCDKFPSALVAAQWACGVLVMHGVTVLVDGQKMSPEAFLSFAPAPEVVA